MDPERWRQIERLYHSTLERPPRERDAFLETECRGDDRLRLEVQALLSRAASAEHFLDRPADDIAVQMLGQPADAALTDLRLGVYVVQEPLGAGGMGVVYRALDTKLHRAVAIKFLSDDLAGPAARARFEREARTASSLNHPHIVTVHDAGEFEGRQYLVTELVDGGTLREWTQRSHGWRETIELLTGVADSLAAAHDAGVLHRDIKPENILIAKSGYAKLADFGLAKLYEGATPDDAASPVTETRTQRGMIAGTVAYMSPEQVSGHRLDARSDIFSFGIVLYEALAGQRLFTGASPPDVMHAILHLPAAPLPEEVPLSLRVIVEKALEKDPAHRFQSMRDLVVELRRAARQTAEAAPAPPMLPRSRRARRWPAAIAALAVVAASIVLFLSRIRQPDEPATREYTQLTNFADSAMSPTLSPDGRMLAFIRGESGSAGQGQIYVKLLPDGEPVQLTHENRTTSDPRFSPDGARIGYTIFDEGAKTLETWTVSVLGGQPRRLLTNASGLTWIQERNTAAGSPVLLFSELTGLGNQMSIVSSTESRTGHRTVYTPPEAGMAHYSHLSPDRQQVLVVEMANKWLPCRLVPFDGGSSGKRVGPLPSQCTHAAWSPDGAWMYFSAARTDSGVHIWRQRFPDGTPEQVTYGVTQEEGIEFAPDGRSFVTSIGTSQSTAWVHDSRGDRQMTSEGYAFLPTISPDGTKLFYLVRHGGAPNFLTGGLWVADLETGQRHRLLPDFLMRHYTISADGQRVVFVASDEAGRTPVWLAALNGRSVPRRLADMDSSYVAYFGAGGDVVFDGEEKGTGFVYRVKDDGSGLQKILEAPNLAVFGVSPDGRWLSAETPAQFGDTLAFPAGGGSPTLICGGCSQPQGTDIVPPRLSWTPDGRFLYLKFAASTYAVPLQPGQMLPSIPAAGFQSKEAVAALPGARLISEAGVFPGPNPSVYAFTKVVTQRNIYRVPVP